MQKLIHSIAVLLTALSCACSGGSATGDGFGSADADAASRADTPDTDPADAAPSDVDGGDAPAVPPCPDVCFDWVSPEPTETLEVTTLEDDVCRSLGSGADGCPLGATCAPIVERWLAPTLRVAKPQCVVEDASLAFDVVGPADGVSVTLALTWNGAPWPAVATSGQAQVGDAGAVFVSPRGAGATRAFPLPTSSDALTIRLAPGVYDLSFAPPPAFDAPYATLSSLGRLEVVAEGRVALDVVGGTIAPEVEADAWSTGEPLQLQLRTRDGFRRVMTVPDGEAPPEALRVQTGSYTLSATDASPEGASGRFAESGPIEVSAGATPRAALSGRSVLIRPTLQVEGADVRSATLLLADVDGRTRSLITEADARVYVGTYRARAVVVLSDGTSLSADLGALPIEADGDAAFTLDTVPLAVLVRTDGEDLRDTATWALDVRGLEGRAESRVLGTGARADARVLDPGAGALLTLADVRGPELIGATLVRGERDPWVPESGAQVIDVATEEVTWAISALGGWTDPAVSVSPSDDGRPRARWFNGVRAAAPTRVSLASTDVTLSRPLDVDALVGVWSATDPSGRAVEAALNVALGSAPVTVQRSPRAASAEVTLTADGAPLREVDAGLNRGEVRYGPQRVTVPPSGPATVEIVFAEAGEPSPGELVWTCVEALGCGLREHFGVHRIADWIGLAP